MLFSTVGRWTSALVGANTTRLSRNETNQAALAVAAAADATVTEPSRVEPSRASY